MDFDDDVTRALRRYARLVTSALGLSGECSCVQVERPVSLYLALDGHLPRFPDDDVALVWDEARGWSMAVESDGGDSLLEVAHLDGQVLAAPRAVAEWAQGLLRARPEQLRRSA